ncbi:Protein ArsC [Paucilactobacillus oligofermentans DSM 15707 = LMG 22743]|nr:arsenate reductase (thioredoxin) [Paucilactobacillus oligofermentans]CUS26309.1 Protein ArsC [Paucilactobacillus oligofermentans DSM 15707 = LMG 22743]
MTQIYFLCTGNSCRSQMAEGYARQLLGDDFIVASAGIETHGLNPIAVKVMNEDGVDISQQTSTLIDADYFVHSNLIITLCGDARDKCPVIPATIKHLHWDLADPAQAQGTEQEVLAKFREIRDDIKQRVLALSI